ncbi:MAG TPA: NAD(P)/FAD-dependent oxidoreductase [Pyrinomonadaceae bacterium]|jgi:geranylgeranyl reductase family protein|nr:NAD(P)/FAD-dependent oxidoreductase [Pyrinomonadaceae bacterium]
MKSFDVIIVGAGPAGSFAAERLARAGTSVALFDGRPAGEPKACGGGVTSKALKAWPHLLEAVGRTIDELDMYSPSGKHLHLKLDEPFAVYSRIAFDTFLRERARDAGALVFAEKISARGFKRIQETDGPAFRSEGSIDPVATARGSDTGWTVRTQGGEEFACRYLVGADGANSAIAKKLAGPLPPAEMEVAFGYRAPLPESGEAATVVAFLPKWVGYAWAFPRIDHVSFGIATTQDAFDHEALDQLMWDFMISYYESVRTAGDSDRIKMRLWKKSGSQSEKSQLTNLRNTAERYAARIPGLAPRTWDARKTCGDGWALLGDAAGFADPVTGEGIYYALRSAELFADAFLKGTPQEYERLWRADFGAELKRASEMRRRFYGNFWGAPFTDRMIEFARGHRGIRKVLGKLVAGDQGYVNLKKKLARSALKPL